jgi:hypothetical protein
MIRRQCTAFTAVLLGLSVLATGARAAEPATPDASAEELIKQGLEHRQRGEKQEALDLFLKAQALAPSARALAQIGSVELAMHHWLDAETHLEQALAKHDSPWIENAKNRDMLEKTLAEARKQVSYVDVRGIAGAEVSIDGHRIGVLPLASPIHVAAGSVRLSVVAPGRKPFEKVLTLAGAEGATVTVELDPLPSPPAVPPTAAAQVAAPAGDAHAGAPIRRWVGGALFVAGLASVGVGIEWVAIDGHTNCNPPPGGRCDQLYDTKTQGWIAIVGGAVAIAGGATLFLWKGGEHRTSVAVGPGSLVLRGSF